jgi:hypothetical protein
MALMIITVLKIMMDGQYTSPFSGWKTILSIYSIYIYTVYVTFCNAIRTLTNFMLRSRGVGRGDPPYLTT